MNWKLIAIIAATAVATAAAVVYLLQKQHKKHKKMHVESSAIIWMTSMTSTFRTMWRKAKKKRNLLTLTARQKKHNVIPLLHRRRGICSIMMIPETQAIWTAYGCCMPDRLSHRQQAPPSPEAVPECQATAARSQASIISC